MTDYAKGTKVQAFRSRLELERLLQKAGATHMVVGQEPGAAVVVFVLRDRRMRMRLRMPQPADFLGTSGRRKVTPAQAEDRAAQGQREKWRALVAAVKGRLVSVSAGIESMEQAFMAYVVTESGATVHERMEEHLREIYTGPERQRLLGSGE